MKFVPVNFHLNQTFFVEDLAFEQAIKLAFKAIKGVKLISLNVEISKSAELFLEIEAEKDKNLPFKKAILDIHSKIDEYIFNLIGAKASNIEIFFSEGKTSSVEFTKTLEVKTEDIKAEKTESKEAK